MAKKVQYNIDWGGNDGRCNSALGTQKTVKCGICGSQMNVRRNVLGATSSVEAMCHEKHRYDSFRCPNIEKSWHEKIVNLKYETYNTASDKIKKILGEEIMELLEANAVR